MKRYTVHGWNEHFGILFEFNQQVVDQNPLNLGNLNNQK